MKTIFMIWVFIAVGIGLNAQDFSVSEVIVYDNLNPKTKVANDSIVAFDTVALAVDLFNHGSGLLGPIDSVSIGLSINGTHIGDFGPPNIGDNLVPSRSLVVIAHNHYQFTSLANIQMCAWPVYTPLGGDPNKSNDTSCKSFTVYNARGVLVTSFNPQEGYRGSEIEVDGHNFDPIPSNNVAKIGNVVATVTNATATKLTITVPNSAVSGNIEVTTAGRSHTSPNSYTVKVPSINQFQPDRAMEGDTINIITTDVISDPDKIEFNGTTAALVKHQQDSVWAIVPTGGTSGKITLDFTVTSATSQGDFVFLGSNGYPLYIHSEEKDEIAIWKYESTLYLRSVKKPSTIQVRDMNGKLLLKQQVELNTIHDHHEIDLQALAPGMYIAQVGYSYLKFTIK